MLQHIGLLRVVQQSEGIVAVDVTASMWAGGGLARTPLHADQTAVIIFQMAGTKTLLLASQEQVITSVEGGTLPQAVQSSGTTADFLDHGPQSRVVAPRVAHVLVHLDEGDALYIPPGYYHDVQYGGTSAAASVSLRFSGIQFAVASAAASEEVGACSTNEGEINCVQ